MKIFRHRHIASQIPNLLLRRRFRFEFELLPYEATGLSNRKIWNFFVAGLNQYFLPAVPFGRPAVAQVEPANFCNLHCPLCLTSSETQSRPRALLPFETYRAFIDEVGDTLLLLILWNWGEPFLNPDLIRMIACAKEKGIVVCTSTNGNVPLDDAKAKALVASGLDGIVFPLDGATQESYAEYRHGGHLEQVLANARAVVRAKRALHSKTPLVNVRFIAMRHNEPELPLVRNIARELGADYFSVKTVDLPTGRAQNQDGAYMPESADLRRYEYASGLWERRARRFECMRPWKRITLDALGHVIPCEFDFLNEGSFGDVRQEPLLGAWKSPAAAAFRKRFNHGNNDFYACRDCTLRNATARECVIRAEPIGDQSCAPA